MPRKRPLAERFSEKYAINKQTGCWDWLGSKSPGGYGSMKYEGSRNAPAHRISYELEKGIIPIGMIVCHKCDNPSCVNPDHLYVGTYQDNMADLKRKGRARAFTAEQAKHLLTDFEAGMLQRELAEKYGVARSTIQKTLVSIRKNGFGGDTPANNIRKYVRLTDRNIIEIVCLLHKEVSINSIAERYYVDRKTVRNIRDKMI